MAAAVCRATPVVPRAGIAPAGRSRVSAALPARHHVSSKKRARVHRFAVVAAAAPAAAAAGGAPVNVLVVGGGGREHALCWRLRQSPSCGDLFCAPGNAGIAVEEGVRVVSLDESDHAAVVAFCADHEIGLVVCGPEAPLVDGLADSLIAADVPCFGPTKAAARLERFGPRCTVELLPDGDPASLAAPADGGADRFVSTYCLDLMSETDMMATLDKAEACLHPERGLLLLAGITWAYRMSVRT